MLSEIALYKPLRKCNASPTILMNASLGLYTVLQNVISMLWGDDTKSVRTGEIKVGNEFFGAYITDIQIITIVVCVALLAACVFFMKYHSIGWNIRMDAVAYIILILFLIAKPLGFSVKRLKKIEFKITDYERGYGNKII